VTGMDTPTPGELARFDQAWTEVNRRLDDLIATHRGVRAEAGATREIDIAGLGVFLRQNTDHEACAEMLSTAIDRLADKP
jgi:hypothetical protein